MAAKGQNNKIGQGHFEAWLRQGAKELAQVLPAFPQSIRPVEEPGLLGNPVPQEVFAQKHNLEAERVIEAEMEM